MCLISVCVHSKNTVEVKAELILLKVILMNLKKLLPFTMTNAQSRVVGECISDLTKGTKPMNRLVQGDVGSGKRLLQPPFVIL